MAGTMDSAEARAEDARITVVQVAAGEAHTLALTAAGSVYTWGRGLSGRPGISVFQDELVPTYVAIGVNPEDGNSTTSWGQLGSVSTRDDSRVHKDGYRAKVTQVASGAHHSLALAVDGTVWSWGYNAYMDGQLGRDMAASQPSPVDFTCTKPKEESRKRGVSSRSNRSNDGAVNQPKIIMVEARGMVSSAIDLDGCLWLWGAIPTPSCHHQSSRARDFSLISNTERPERVSELMGLRVYRVACGNEHILALVEGRDDTENDCYAWGSNSYGQLGLGDTKARSYPQVVKGLAASAIGSIVDLACGAFHSAVLAVRGDQPADLVLEPSESPQASAHSGGRNRPMFAAADIMQESFSPRVRSRQLAELIFEAAKLRQRQPEQLQRLSETSSSVKSTAWGSSRISSNRSLGQYSSNKSTEPFNLEFRVSVCWTFGQGENGQLGHGTALNQAYPSPVESLPNERLRTVACGQFHTSVVTETGDVWVWGMEGGLGMCPGIGTPDARTGDALVPVRVFGDSSANCHPVTGSKGIACGVAHTVTLANGGRDIWAWGRGQSGALGLGHVSDTWFPCPVVWPPVSSVPSSSSSSTAPWVNPGAKTGLKQMTSSLYPMGFDLRRSLSRPSSRAGSVEREEAPMKPPKETAGVGARYKRSNYGNQLAAVNSEEVSAMKKELAGVRRYSETLHAAIYGDLETYPPQQPGGVGFYADGSSDSCGLSSDQLRRGSSHKNQAIEEWEWHVESASVADLERLDQFYRSMRTRLKDLLFQRKMDDWCRRCMSGLSPSSSNPMMSEPLPTRDSNHLAATMPAMERAGELAISMSGLLSDRAGMLPPGALAATLAEFMILTQRRGSSDKNS